MVMILQPKILATTISSGLAPVQKRRMGATAGCIRVELGVRGKKPQLPPVPEWLAHLSSASDSSTGG
jgi:hypothetical protein